MSLALPTVDVIIPAFNAEAYLAETLRAVLAQHRVPDRIIVVNDGSSDGTAGLLEAFSAELGDHLLIVNQPNQGLSAARNAGLAASTAHFVAFVDADDVWLPGKLEAQLALMAASSEVGVVYCDFELIDEQGCLLNGPRFHLNPEVRGQVSRYVRHCNCIAGSASAVLIRRELFEQAGGFDVALRSAEDWDMWIRLARITCFDFVNAPLVRIRRHGQSMQANPDKMLHGELLLFDKQLKLGEQSWRHLLRLRYLLAQGKVDISSLSCASALSPACIAYFSGASFERWKRMYRLARGLKRGLQRWLG